MGKLSKFMDKLSIKPGGSDLPPAAEAVSQPVTQKQLHQTRFNFGVNFGGVFVREKWIFHSTFPEGTDTELAAVAKSARADRAQARETLESHWKNYASADDWEWLQKNGVNSVRVPLGYWNIDGGNYTADTQFSAYKDIYANSWSIFKTHYVEPAAQKGISVLVDIHGLPGGANADAHSGEGGGKAGFWGSPGAQKLMTKALAFVARDLQKYDNISGIQIVNEAEFSDPARHQKAYYASAIQAIREHDASVPVVISDGWWPNQWVEWVQKAQGDGHCAGVVIDAHCYRCFSDADKNKSADQIVQDLHGDLLTNLTDGGKGVDLMVGEWSSVLDGQTWAKCGLDPSDGANPRRKELAGRFCSKQAELIRQRAGAGSYFWTYKFESGNGGEWDFRQQLGHAFSAPRVSVPDDAAFNSALEREYNGHCNYWNGQNPDEKYEHERYKEGFTTAWQDGVTYAKAGALVGRKQPVRSARLSQHLQSKGRSAFVWEWEQGYDKGLDEFSKAIQ